MKVNPHWEPDPFPQGLGKDYALYIYGGYLAIKLRIEECPSTEEFAIEIGSQCLPETRPTLLEAQLYAEETAREWLKDALKELESEDG